MKERADCVYFSYLTPIFIAIIDHLFAFQFNNLLVGLPRQGRALANNSELRTFLLLFIVLLWSQNSVTLTTHQYLRGGAEAE